MSEGVPRAPRAANLCPKHPSNQLPTHAKNRHKTPYFQRHLKAANGAILGVTSRLKYGVCQTKLVSGKALVLGGRWNKKLFILEH